METPAAAVTSPYLAQRAFAAAALVPRTYHGANVAFWSCRRRCWQSTAPGRRAWKRTGRRPWLAPGARRRAVHRELRRSRPRTLRLRADVGSGVVREASFSFEVAALAAPLPTATWPITATVPFQGVYGFGEAYVYLAPGHATVTEPVVIVEGFDMDNIMDWDELYDLLNQENMLEELRADGFDAVVLNFNDSTDDMRRNAMILTELLRQVELAQPDGRDRIVIGASMGGLVSRYALAWLEHQGLDHNARAFISFDSPQMGANIPLGVQYWLQLFQVESTEAGYLLSRLDRPPRGRCCSITIPWAVPQARPTRSARHFSPTWRRSVTGRRTCARWPWPTAAAPRRARVTRRERSSFPTSTTASWST
ncbi:MAG: hypothetical protein IPH86_09170 [bacterium]|nr:hypothetical protein [bacterium]